LLRRLFLFSLFLSPAFADSTPTAGVDVGQQVLARYFAAVNAQSPKTRGLEMDMDFSARLPRMKKEGAMLARRIVSSLGKISFIVKTFTGDNTIKKDVIARYLSAEQEAAGAISDVAINPKNYKFKYKWQDEFNGARIHVYELNPRKKQVGLFKGELWIDEGTALPVRETGQFVKNPSVFLKKVLFTRTYAMHYGVALPAHIESTVETRIAGKAELDIRYSNFIAAWQMDLDPGAPGAIPLRIPIPMP
jgi:hypothetical protein